MRESILRYFFRWLRWKREGSKMISYTGCNCGCCGRWLAEPFEIREMDSAGRWWDTWSVCPGDTTDCCWSKDKNTT